VDAVTGYPGAAAAGAQRHDEDVIDLRALWDVLVRRRSVIIALAILGVLIALVATFVATPVYRSTVLLQIETEGSRVVDYGSVTQEEVAGYRANQDFYKTQYELLESRTLARRVMDQLGLEMVANPERGVRALLHGTVDTIKSWLALVTAADPAASESGLDAEVMAERKAEEAFLAHLTVEPIRDSRLVRIHYDSSSPIEAAEVANAVAANFIALNLERRYDASAYAKQFLQDQLAQARATLEDAEKRFVAYAREREIVNTNDRLEITLAKLREMNTQLVMVEAERIAAEAEYQELLASGAKGVADVLDSQLVQKLKERRSELEAEYRENLKVLKPKYPTMVQLREQIGELSQQINGEVASISSGIKGRYESKMREEAKLTQRIAELKEEALTLQDRSTDYETLRREVQTSRELFDGLLQRMKEVGVAAGIGENNISIVDPALVPAEPYKPSLELNLFLGFGLGLFAGLALAFLLDALDDRLKSPEELEELTGASVLTLIPRVSAGELGLAPAELGLLTHHDPTSPLAEAVRSLRTQLLFSTPDGVPDVLHFVSAVPGEGKTTASANAAIAFAQAGSSVLLIDADLRNPSLHHVFSLPNISGLSNHLIGSATALEVSQPTPVRGLFTITSGPLPPNPVELLMGARMVDLLRLASERFDLVIVDSPPVIGLADALVLGNLAKATVLVVDLEQSGRREIAGAVRRLRQANVRLAGTVLSKVGRSGSGYGYGYGYGYSYEYGANRGGVGRLPKPATA
jgi:capsular exopolysaccharide synthesis family protein